MSRKRLSAQEKAKIALEAIRGDKTVAEISSIYGVHSTQISNWKRQALSGMVDIFSDKRHRQAKDHEGEASELYKHIGKLKVENEFLKKICICIEFGLQERNHPQRLSWIKHT